MYFSAIVYATTNIKCVRLPVYQIVVTMWK